MISLSRPLAVSASDTYAIHWAGFHALVAHETLM